jgi:hypothetical protein
MRKRFKKKRGKNEGTENIRQAEEEPRKENSGKRGHKTKRKERDLE